MMINVFTIISQDIPWHPRTSAAPAGAWHIMPAPGVTSAVESGSDMQDFNGI